MYDIFRALHPVPYHKRGRIGNNIRILKLSLSLLSVLSISLMTFATPASLAQVSSSTIQGSASEQAQEDEILSTIDMTTEFLHSGHKDIGGLKLTPRWSDVRWLEPDSISVIFADCLPDEFALSGQAILQDSNLRILESYSVAMRGGFMSWIYVIDNTNLNERLPTAAGVICADEHTHNHDDDPHWKVIFRKDVRHKTDDIINKIVVIGSKHVNIKQIVNMKQVINQIAVQVAFAGGDASRVINQIDSQASEPGGKKANVERFILQLANKAAEGDISTVNRTIDNLAEKTVTSGSNATLDLSQLPEQFEQQNTTSGVPEGRGESNNATTQGNATGGGPTNHEALNGREQMTPERPTESSGNGGAQG
jgi:hypothetical protein